MPACDSPERETWTALLGAAGDQEEITRSVQSRPPHSAGRRARDNGRPQTVNYRSPPGVRLPVERPPIGRHNVSFAPQIADFLPFGVVGMAVAPGAQQFSRNRRRSDGEARSDPERVRRRPRHNLNRPAPFRGGRFARRQQRGGYLRESTPRSVETRINRRSMRFLAEKFTSLKSTAV